MTKSNTSYVLDFSIYSGVFSTLRDTVFQLVDRFRGKGYHLFMDNYYNSVALAQELYDAEIHCSGTFRLVRGASTVLKDVGQNPRLLPKGETRVVKKKTFFSFRVFFRKKTCFFRVFFVFFSLHPISSFLKTLLKVIVNLRCYLRLKPSF